MASKVIQFSKVPKSGYIDNPTLLAISRENYLYTLDMLINDSHKEHYREHCVICEPMKLLGFHRDQAIEEMACTMVTVFFEDFEEYREEVKGVVIERLLRRDLNDKVYSSIKEKVEDLILEQLRSDVEDFVVDIEKHLVKHTQSGLSKDRVKTIIDNILKNLKRNWVT